MPVALIVVVALALPLLLFPLAFVWYLNVTGEQLAKRAGRRKDGRAAQGDSPPLAPDDNDEAQPGFS